MNATAAATSLPVVDTGSTVLTTLGYLCLLLGVIFTAYYLLKRFGINGMGMSTAGGPQLLSRLMLGSQQSVAVIRYRDKDLVLGVTGDRISLLTEFDADESAETEPASKNFASFLQRSTDDEG